MTGIMAGTGERVMGKIDLGSVFLRFIINVG